MAAACCASSCGGATSPAWHTSPATWRSSSAVGAGGRGRTSGRSAWKPWPRLTSVASSGRGGRALARARAGSWAGGSTKTSGAARMRTLLRVPSTRSLAKRRRSLQGGREGRKLRQGARVEPGPRHQVHARHPGARHPRHPRQPAPCRHPHLAKCARARCSLCRRCSAATAACASGAYCGCCPAVRAAWCRNSRLACSGSSENWACGQGGRGAGASGPGLRMHVVAQLQSAVFWLPASRLGAGQQRARDAPSNPPQPAGRPAPRAGWSGRAPPPPRAAAARRWPPAR